MRSTKNLKFLFLFTVIVAIGIFCRQTCYAFESGTFLLSNGTSLIKCIIKENKASLTKDLLNGNEWSYVTWPCYDKKSETIYFEAENKNYGSNRSDNIFSEASYQISTGDTLSMTRLGILIGLLLKTKCRIIAWYASDYDDLDKVNNPVMLIDLLNKELPIGPGEIYIDYE